MVVVDVMVEIHLDLMVAMVVVVVAMVVVVVGVFPVSFVLYSNDLTCKA